MKELEKRKSEFYKEKIKNGGIRKTLELKGAEPPAVRKGQIRVDFIFALVFFTIIIFYVGIQVNNALTSSLTDSRLDTLKSEANSVLDVIVSAGGSPANWETLSEDQVIRVGLAQTPYNLSSAKVAALNNNCNLMKKFGSINYKLIITAGNNILLSCGYGGPRITSKSERAVYANGKYGKVTLEMW